MMMDVTGLCTQGETKLVNQLNAEFDRDVHSIS